VRAISLQSNEDFRGDVESAAKPANVLRSELPFSMENLGNDAGRPENIDQIFLLQIVVAHQLG
jgi:hypothetical protein